MERNYFNKIEIASRKQLRQLQLKRLKGQVDYLYHHSPYYRKIFKEQGITPDIVRSLEDLKRLPFLDKHTIGESQEEHPPFGQFLCVPESEIVKFFRTSGTTLKPRNFAYTYDDWWNISVEFMARIMYSLGAREKDRVFIAFPYSTFVALWSTHYASAKIGCMVIPGGGISTKERLNLMKDMQATILCGTPTYVYRLANVAEEEGIDIRSIPLRIIKTGGEPLSSVPGSRKRLEEAWHAKVYDEYGASETLIPVGGECAEQAGLHVPEDFLIPEILNEAGEQVALGGPGELVVSNIVSKSMPLLRFKTGDMVTYTDEPCRCGRKTIRIKVIGRKDDMIIIKGTNVYPSAIEEIVKRQPDLCSEFMIVIDEINGVYELIIQVEPRGKEQFCLLEQEQVKNRLVEIVRENLRLRPVIQIMGPGSLPRFEVKSRRIVDKRVKKG